MNYLSEKENTGKHFLFKANIEKNEGKSESESVQLLVGNSNKSSTNLVMYLMIKHFCNRNETVPWIISSNSSQPNLK